MSSLYLSSRYGQHLGRAGAHFSLRAPWSSLPPAVGKDPRFECTRPPDSGGTTSCPPSPPKVVPYGTIAGGPISQIIPKNASISQYQPNIALLTLPPTCVILFPIVPEQHHTSLAPRPGYQPDDPPLAPRSIDFGSPERTAAWREHLGTAPHFGPLESSD
jgi:hypothetical protein